MPVVIQLVSFLSNYFQSTKINHPKKLSPHHFTSNLLAIKKITSKEYCFDVAETQCNETEETIENEICVIDYQSKERIEQAESVKVTFERVCESQMVTVCDPNYLHGHYFPGFEAHCRELEQKTCYNIPKVMFAFTIKVLIVIRSAYEPNDATKSDIFLVGSKVV